MRILSFPIIRFVSKNLRVTASRPFYFCLRGAGALARAISAAHFALTARTRMPAPRKQLIQNLRNRAGAYRAAAFANREPESLFHRYRRDQLNLQLHVIAWPHHLGPRRQLRRTVGTLVVATALWLVVVCGSGFALSVAIPNRPGASLSAILVTLLS